MKSAGQTPFRVDFYELLDVQESADAEELKLAYRRQAKRFHPDHNPGSAEAEERFKRILEAYRVLGDEELRGQYDAWLARQRLFVRAPELEGLGGRVRVSARHGRERREERRRARRSAGTFRRARAASRGMFSEVKMPRVGMYVRLAFYAMALFIIAPLMLRGVHSAMNRHSRVSAPVRPQGQTDLPPEEVQARLMKRNAELLIRAEQGDAAAQFQYGWNMYHGYNGMQVNRPEAKGWFERAAAAGHDQAQQILGKADFSQPPSAGDEGAVPGATEAAQAPSAGSAQGQVDDAAPDVVLPPEAGRVPTVEIPF